MGTEVYLSKHIVDILKSTRDADNYVVSDYKTFYRIDNRGVVHKVVDEIEEPTPKATKQQKAAEVAATTIQVQDEVATKKATKTKEEVTTSESVLKLSN